MYKKTIIRHLKNGGKLRDLIYYEPGRCSNGVRYLTCWKIIDGELMSVSSYEDAGLESARSPWDQSLKSALEGLASYASKHWHDQPLYIGGDRFELA